jgi:hypothetical protein
MVPEKIVEMAEPGFLCRTCGQTHEGVPLSFAADFPDMYANMSEPDRSARALISSDQCIVDEASFFIRGCLEIPVRDTGEVFIWGLDKRRGIQRNLRILGGSGKRNAPRSIQSSVGKLTLYIPRNAQFEAADRYSSCG